MTAHSDSKIPFHDAHSFIEALAEETGVSRRFLDDARPIIERAFTEVGPEMRAECLEMIRLTVRTQAETEEAVRRSLEQAEKLVAAEKALSEKLDLLREEALAAKEKVAAAAMGLYRWHTPSLDTN